jgi:predicted ABC-type ATPase
MNVDRIPDDPVPAAETAHLPDSPQTDAPRPTPEPEHPSPTEQRQPPDREPEPERESHDQQRDPESEHRPESPAPANDPDVSAPTDSPGRPTGNTPDTADTAEPRSRQEHADPPPTNEREFSADDIEDGAPIAVDEAGLVPEDSDADGPFNEISAQEERGEDLDDERRNPDSPPDDLPAHEASRTDHTEVSESFGVDARSSDQEDQPSEEASDLAELTDDALPVQDGTSPLTDKEWSEHQIEVRDTLDKARAAGLTTDRLYTIDPDHKEWTTERNRLQGALVADLYERARDVPCDYQAVIAGGLGGAGKTTVLSGYADIDLSSYLTINPDDIKEEMARRGMIPEMDKLSPMEASDLAHEESSYIAKRLALRAMADGKNIIWDITMSSERSTEDRINNLRDATYTKIDGVFVDIPPDISITRTESRHREGHEQWRAGHGQGGRFVPPEVIRGQLDSQWGSQNRRTYEAMKEKFTSWSIYDNSVDGRSPVLIDSSEREKPDPRHTERSV